MENREIRGLAIISKGTIPQSVSKDTYLVPSQSNESKKYKVSHIQKWTCNCPDFKSRNLECKHIHAIKFWIKVKTKADLGNFNLEEELNKEVCPECNSNNLIKRGKRKNKNGIKQIYYCDDCKKRFVLEPLKYIKGNSKLVCLAMDCFYKGLSLRDIKDQFKQFYDLDISHETIRRWITRFTKVIDNHTKNLKAETSNIWHADEQMVKTKDKDFIYNWNVMDKETKFVLATHSSRGRSIDDAKKVMLKAKEQAKQIPEVIITDKLPSYQEGISKAFRNWQSNTHKQVKHISIVGKRSLVNNNLIENHHTHFREFDKVRRGINEVQDYSDGFNIFRNFIKKGIDGLTPAERAKLDLHLGNNRWTGLLIQSLKATNMTETNKKEESH